MSDETQVTYFEAVSRRVEDVVDQGERYAKAILSIDPSLASIGPTDIAFGVDVGRGADIVAFRNLGFTHVVATNDSSASFQLSMGKEVKLEIEVLSELQKAGQLPEKTHFSSLSLTDWLAQPNFSPRLITMLRMAPKYFYEDDPSYFLKEIIAFYNSLRGKSTIILSALNDHDQSKTAFIAAAKVLDENRDALYQLLIDEAIPPQLETLGKRILILKK